VDDPLWESHFTGLFTPEAFPVPFYPIRGNHDYRSSNPDAQLEYYTEHGDEGRWVFPAAYYQINKVLADGTTIDLIFLDTLLLAPEATESEAAIHLPADKKERREEQYAWVEATLAQSTADWLLVFGHYPIFSVGEHGDTPGLIARLLPLFERHHVDMYVSGHDHTLQHLQHLPKTHTQFFVNGNGAKVGTVGNVTQAAHVRQAEVTLGFMSHEVTRTSLRTKAIDREGGVVFEYSQLPRRRAALLAEAEEGRGMSEGEEEEWVFAGSMPVPVAAVPQKHISGGGGGAMATRQKQGGEVSSSSPSMRGGGGRKRHYLLSSSSAAGGADKQQQHSYLRGRESSLLLMSLLGMVLVVMTILYKRRPSSSSSSSSFSSSSSPLPMPSLRRGRSSYLQLFVALTGGQQEEEREEEREEGEREGRFSAVQLLEHSWQAEDSDVEEDEDGREEGKEEQLP
jgi:hypothetical protein